MEEHALYYVTVNWWNDFEDKEITSHFYAFAKSLSDLSDRIENSYKYIDSVKIKMINLMCGDEDFFYADDLTRDERKKFESCNEY